MATYTLGRDYTVSGLTGASELTVTREGERIDVTTREHAKPFKLTVAGFPATTIECSVFATATTNFTVGSPYTITLNGEAFTDVVCMAATREEPQSGIITYRLKFRPGTPHETANRVQVGPGDYRTGGGGGA